MAKSKAAAKSKRQASLANPFPGQEYDPAVPDSELNVFPGNARRGNIDEIRASIRENGFHGALLVQRSTHNVVVGNNRRAAGKLEGMSAFPVFWADIDDETADRMNAADNRTNDLAGYEPKMLASLLERIQGSSRGLVGTGYDGGDLARIRKGLEPPHPPGEFRSFDATTSTTSYECPNCNHKFVASVRNRVSPSAVQAPDDGRGAGRASTRPAGR